MRLRVEFPVQTDKTVAMLMSGIVMRPVHDRQSARIVNHLAADLDAVPNPYRTAWCNTDVIDDLDSARTALYVECFVQGMRARAIKESRRRGDGCVKVDPRRCGAGIRSGQVHAPLITRFLRWERSGM